MGSVIGLNGCIHWCEGVIGYNGWFYRVRETTRPFRYDLNQIPYNHTVEVTNRFKRLDLIDRVSAWRTMDGGLWHCTGISDQDNHQEKEMQKGKMVVWGGFTNSYEK